MAWCASTSARLGAASRCVQSRQPASRVQICSRSAKRHGHRGRRSVRMEVQQEETAYALDNEEYTELRALDTLLARNTGAPNLYIVDREVQRAVNALATDHQRGMNQLDESNDGVWEVFYAPHIESLSRLALGTHFRPLRYTISQGGTHIRSDVRYDSPVYGKGWLSAEGRFEMSKDGASSVQLVLESFWVEAGGDDYIAPEGNPTQNLAGRSLATAAINMLGRLTFIPPLAMFPVLYFSSGENLCIFSFPPLSSNIAARRVDMSLVLPPL